MNDKKRKMPWYGILTIVAISVVITEYYQSRYELSNLAYGILVGICVIGIWTLAEKFILTQK